MRWRLVLSALTAALLAVLAAVAAVAALVPLSFTVTVPGLIVPERELRVTATGEGRLLELRGVGPVLAGELLFRLDTEAEERRLAALERELAVLREREAHEAARLEAAARWREADLRLLEVRERRLEADRAARSGPLAEAREALRRNEAEQLRVDDELAASESAILQRLAAELSVPAMELARGQARAAKTALLRTHSDLTGRLENEQRQADVLQLQIQAEEVRIEADRLGLQLDDRRQLLELRTEIGRGEAEQIELQRAIERKRALAPWAGFWGDRTGEPGEFVTPGVRLGTLRRETPLHVIGQAREADAAWLRLGQQAQVRVDAFPFIKYGRLEGRLVRLESRLGDAGGVFLVDVALAGTSPVYRPVPGQRGQIDVVVFNGTLVRYLAAEPDSADDGSGRQGPPVDLRRLLLRR